jgi:hypothetical protein
MIEMHIPSFVVWLSQHKDVLIYTGRRPLLILMITSICSVALAWVRDGINIDTDNIFKPNRIVEVD